ncbi:MAG: hypothetical protein GX941_07575, partial [Candidatus Methanofastidiosa archaeon]|nr:hypothetical protein [Candidatus Methanofastidiosa archaeon]
MSGGTRYYRTIVVKSQNDKRNVKLVNLSILDEKGNKVGEAIRDEITGKVTTNIYEKLVRGKKYTASAKIKNTSSESTVTKFNQMSTALISNNNVEEDNIPWTFINVPSYDKTFSSINSNGYANFMWGITPFTMSEDEIILTTATENARIFDAIQTSDGGYIALGKKDDELLMIKVNSNGTVDWKKTSYLSSLESPKKIIQTSDGGYVVQTGNSWDIDCVFKFDSFGSFMWEYRPFGSSATGINSIILADDGNSVVIVGYSDVPTEKRGYDAIIQKINSSTGSVVWKKTWGGGIYSNHYIDEVFNSVSTTQDGGFIVSCKKSGQQFLIKYNSSGNLIWEKAIDKTIYSIEVTSDNGFIITGTLEKYVGTHTGFIEKYDPNGMILWSNTFGSSDKRNDNTDFYSLVPTQDGGCIVYGKSYSTDGDLEDLEIDDRYGSDFIVKYDSNGNVGWKKVVSNWPYIINLTSRPVIISTNDGGCAVLDSIYNNGKRGFNLIKYETPDSVLPNNGQLRVGASIPALYYKNFDNYDLSDDYLDIIFKTGTVGEGDMSIEEEDIVLLDSSGNEVKEIVKGKTYTVQYKVGKPEGLHPVGDPLNSLENPFATIVVNFEHGDAITNNTTTSTDVLTTDKVLEYNKKVDMTNKVYAEGHILKVCATVDPRHAAVGQNMNPNNDSACRTWTHALNFAVKDFKVTPNLISRPTGDTSNKELGFSFKISCESKIPTFYHVPVIIKKGNQIIKNQKVYVMPNSPFAQFNWTIPDISLVPLGTETF